MGKSLFFSVAAGGLLLLGLAAASFAGVDPSPFEPGFDNLRAITCLNAVANQVQDIQTRLEEVLLALPFDIAEHIVIAGRMEMEPSIWLPFRDISIRIIKLLNARILPGLPSLLPPQLPASPRDIQGRSHRVEICAWRQP